MTGPKPDKKKKPGSNWPKPNAVSLPTTTGSVWDIPAAPGRDLRQPTQEEVGREIWESIARDQYRDQVAQSRNSQPLDSKRPFPIKRKP